MCALEKPGFNSIAFLKDASASAAFAVFLD
jgi:hypothetical protein